MIHKEIIMEALTFPFRLWCPERVLVPLLITHQTHPVHRLAPEENCKSACAQAGVPGTGCPRCRRPRRTPVISLALAGCASPSVLFVSSSAFAKPGPGAATLALPGKVIKRRLC